MEARPVGHEADRYSHIALDASMLGRPSEPGLVRVCCAVTRLVQGLNAGIPLAGQDLSPPFDSCQCDASRKKGVELGLGVRGAVRIGATVAGCALVAACTPDQPPTSTPTPAVTATPSPTASASPTETDIERRMRLDWEAAEKAYRTSIAEVSRLAQKGVPSHLPEL